MRTITTALFVALVVTSLASCNLVRDSLTSVEERQYNELVRPIVRLTGKVMLPDGRVAGWHGSGVVVYSQKNATGCGFDNYILTCNHCVEVPVFSTTASPDAMQVVGYTYKVDNIEIFDTQMTPRNLTGTVVAQSNNNIFMEDSRGFLYVNVNGTIDVETGLPSGEDLALIRLDTTEELVAAKMLPEEQVKFLKPFTKVRVVGCALGGYPYNTFGEITLHIPRTNYMGINAQIVGGNSGGACYLNDTHEFIGITNAGVNSANHLSLVRPLSHIYPWLRNVKHDFVFDTEIPDSVKFATILDDVSLSSTNRKIENDSLMEEVRKIRTATMSLLETVKDLQGQLNALRAQVQAPKQEVSPPVVFPPTPPSDDHSFNCPSSDVHTLPQEL